MRRCLSATSALSFRAARRSLATASALSRSDDDAAWHAAQACRLVLVSTDPAEKAAALGVELGQDLEQVAVRSHHDLSVSGAPSQVLDTAPARPNKPDLVYGPFQRGNHSLPQYLLHSLAHIELNAVDIYAHTVAAWGPGGPKHESGGGSALPSALWLDLARVAQDEARHYFMLERRMRAIGSFYGAMPAHRALWSHAEDTNNDLMGRLAVIPMVQEAHALDSGPRIDQRLRSCNDHASADVVAQIVEEEVGHVSVGLCCFQAASAAHGLDPVEAFHERVRSYVPRLLPGPFNEALRSLAGMGPEYYKPLQSPPRRHPDKPRQRKQPKQPRRKPTDAAED